MRTRLAIKVHTILDRYFPERRVFLRSDADTRFIRLGPATQIFAVTGASAIIAWSIIATSILVMDSIGSGNFREQAKRDLVTYETRLNALAAERDMRAEEAVAAQDRFNSALAQISEMQSQLLASEIRRRELETGIDVIQATLRRTMTEREDARKLADALSETAVGKDGIMPGQFDATASEGTLDLIITALSQTARERDKITADAQLALQHSDEMAEEIRLMQDKNELIFSEIEDAMTISMEPLDKMFRAAGLNTKTLLDSVRSGYSGLGGPLKPLSVSTKGQAPSPDEARASRIIERLDELNLYRLAAQKTPFALPLKNAFRYTSGFGGRWGRMHEGIDLAGSYGTPIYATADGIVTHANWLSGYGQLVKIKHKFGIETRYGHLSRFNVKVGQRVSRGDRIGDMGSTGRSTGTHLHYEVRVDGNAVNPMTFIKAAKDVF